MAMLMAKKEGMTRVFTENGVSIPVTVLSVSKQCVVQVKTKDVDGYEAYQIGLLPKKNLNQPELGHLKKHGIEDAFSKLYEASFDNFTRKLSAGDLLGSSEFDSIKYVDVTGITKGKGFTGVIKRWNFKTQAASHGNSLSGRVPGSIGANQDPGKVWKNKKMPGHDGNQRVTVHGLEIVSIDNEQGLILVKGAVPGAVGFMVSIRKAIKK